MRIAMGWMVPLVLSGCTPDNEETLLGCQEQGREDVGEAGVVPEGFSLAPEAAEALVNATLDGTVEADEAEGEPVVVVMTGTLTHIVQRAWGGSSDGGIEPAIDSQDGCLDGYVGTGSVRVTVEGVDLDLDLDAAVSVDADGSASVRADAPYTGDEGIAPTAFDPDAMTSTTLWVGLIRSDDAWIGEVGFRGELVEEGPDGTASATQETWATFDLTVR